MATVVEDIPHTNASFPSFFHGLRAAFYLLTPSESSFERMSDVPDYVNGAIPHFFILIIMEMVILYLKGKDLRLNDKLTSVGAGLYSQVLGLMGLKALEFSLYVKVYDNYRVYELPWDSAWTWILMALAYDVLYYWFHRMAHEVNFLWNTHQTHHSSEDYALTTALRQSATQTYASVFFYLPAAFVVPPSVYVVHKQLNLLYQFWIHTELVDSLGPLEYILNTPSHHRVHHGRNPYCIDRNYAAVLIIWDRMFGTFQPELKEEKVVYGLVHPINTFDSNAVQLDHYSSFVRNFWRTPGLGNKFKFLFCGPGWSPGTPRLGNREDLPKIVQPVTVYNPKVSDWLNGYVLAHFLLAVSIYNLATYHHLRLPTIAIVTASIFILASLTCFGYLFDKRLFAKMIFSALVDITTEFRQDLDVFRSFGPAVEFLRCAVCASISYLYRFYISKYLKINEGIVMTMFGIFLLSSFTWLFVGIGTKKEKEKSS